MLHEPLSSLYPPERLVWFVVSILYLSSAVYIRVKYRWLHQSITLALFFAGSALFVAANVNLLFPPPTYSTLFYRMVIASFFVIAWVFSLWAIKTQVETILRLQGARWRPDWPPDPPDSEE